MEIGIELPAVRLAVIEAQELAVSPGGGDLELLVDAVCRAKRREFTLESLPEAEPIRAVRAMFREWGMDPSKYRPSSEALLRRVVQGRGLYRVSNVVDIGNLGSVETGWPYGCYDREKITSPIVFRRGTPGERYERVGKQIWHLADRPVLADSEGPFGSPISDSTRSMITQDTRSALVVIYAPGRASARSLEDAVSRLATRLREFAQASAVCVAGIE
jgi:DNA/RNA-binding domain of Phe-tRNA-synthetase-like protein